MISGLSEGGPVGRRDPIVPGGGTVSRLGDGSNGGTIGADRSGPNGTFNSTGDRCEGVNRDALGPVLVAVLAVVALGVGAASLDSPTETSGVAGRGGGSDAGVFAGAGSTSGGRRAFKTVETAPLS